MLCVCCRFLMGGRGISWQSNTGNMFKGYCGFKPPISKRYSCSSAPPTYIHTQRGYDAGSGLLRSLFVASSKWVKVEGEGGREEEEEEEEEGGEECFPYRMQGNQSDSLYYSVGGLLGFLRCCKCNDECDLLPSTSLSHPLYQQDTVFVWMCILKRHNHRSCFSWV